MLINLIPIVFAIGYIAIILEAKIKVNKVASSLLTGVLCWVIYIYACGQRNIVTHSLLISIGEISSILLFFIGAMTIVEIIDAHDGFGIITQLIKTNYKEKLLWIVAMITFFLSAVLDNLTTTIMMISLIRKLLHESEQRLLYVGIIVIAANAGGVWSPIGDVTTSMLWISGRITTIGIIVHTFIPCMICIILPLILLRQRIKGIFVKPKSSQDTILKVKNYERIVVFFLGMGSLIFVPVFVALTDLPPFMGMLFALSIMWVSTEFIHREKSDADKKIFSITIALRKIDIPIILFFLGLLLSISSLQSSGYLIYLASLVDKYIHNQHIIVILLGFISSIFDNVPLVAASMGMYDLNHFHVDNPFWLFLSYCIGTGGSILIIGSAAGIAAMGMEKINFFWYIKNISILAITGYLAGVTAFLVQNIFF